MTVQRRRTWVLVALGLVGLTLVTAGRVTSSRAPVVAAAHHATPTRTPLPSAPPAGAARLRGQQDPVHLLVDAVHLVDDSAAFAGAPALPADTGILFDIDTHEILWQRNMHAPHAPASTTKVLTAMVAAENLDPDSVLTVTPDALGQASDETRLGLLPGEQLTVRELMKGMLMVSANDAATALAVDSLGWNRWMATMNAQLQALGLHDSHFVTPVGLDDPGNRASAYDLGVIGMEDMLHYPIVASIAGEHDDLLHSPTHRDYPVHNLNRLLEIYPAAVGIKPGWTGDAGPSLVAMAQRGGHRLIGVLLNDKHLYPDMRSLLEWGFYLEAVPPMQGLPPA